MGAGGAFHVALARVGAVELGTTGNAGLLGASGGLRSLSAEVAPGARLYIGESSVGAGVGLRAASLSSASAEWRRALPLGDQGEARTSVAHSVWADGRARVGRGTLGVLGRASRANGVQWTEAHVGASLALGALTLSGFAGGRTGFRGEQWGGGGAALRVASGVELVGQLARQPSDPLTGQPGARTAALGITLSHGGQPARSSGRPRAVRLSLRAIPGARVELMGDWNDWRPEPVTDQGGGVFAGEVHLPPGIYHFVFRVNGELRVPEGYDTVPDDFGGRSAVVRVRG